MESEAFSAGFFIAIGVSEIESRKHPRFQLRAVKELMESKGIERSRSAASVDDTFKKAPKAKAKGHEQ